jgi:hypothetical protein
MTRPERKTQIPIELPQCEILRDMLLLVDVKVTLKDLRSRSLKELQEAEKWAAREHLRASDNPVRRVSKPEWLPPSETEKRLLKPSAPKKAVKKL